MSDALLFVGCFLACWLAAGAAVVVLINRARRRRPYLAARLDEKTGDWVDERSDMSLADLDLCNRLWDLPVYSASRERLKHQITSDPYYEATFERIADDELAPDLADFAKRLLKEARDEGDDHTTTNPTGES